MQKYTITENEEVTVNEMGNGCPGVCAICLIYPKPVISIECDGCAGCEA